MNIFMKLTIKYLSMNKTRTIVTIIGVILSAAMITAVTTLISSLQYYLLQNVIYIEGDWHGAFYDIDTETLQKVKHDDKIESAAVAENIGYANIGSSNEYKPYLFIMGADDLFMERMPIHLVSGRLPQTPEEIILPEHLAYNGGVVYKIGDVLHLEIGERYYKGQKLIQTNSYVHPDDVIDRADLDENDNSPNSDANAADRDISYDADDGDEITRNADENKVIRNNINSETKPETKSEESKENLIAGEELVIKESRTYTVVGFYERPGFENYSAPGYTAITKMDYSRALETYAVYFKMNNPRETFNYVDNSGLQGTVNRDYLMFSGYSRYDIFYVILYSLAAILIGLIMFGSVSLIYNAFAISVSERTKQFGLLASIGATKRQSRKMVLYEALFVSFIGIPLGILSGIIGIGITLSLLGEEFSSFSGSSGLTMKLYVTIESIIAACVIALITVLISAWIPSKRATKITPIDAIRLSKDIVVNPGEVKTSKITYKLFGLEGMIAKKHFKRSRKKYRATIVSLFISIVLFISTISFCTYLTDSITSVFQDSDYDIIYRYVFKKGESIDLSELTRVYSELSAADGVFSSNYVLTNTLSDFKIPKSMLSNEFVEYFNLPEETTEVPINIIIYGIADDVYKNYLKENNLKEEIYMDESNPKGMAQALISRFDPALQRYVKIPIFKENTIILDYKDYDEIRDGQAFENDSWTNENDNLTNENDSQTLKNGNQTFENGNQTLKNDSQNIEENDNRTAENFSLTNKDNSQVSQIIENNSQTRENRQNLSFKSLTFDITDKDLVLGLNESFNNSVKIMYPISVYQELFNADYCTFFFKTKTHAETYDIIKNSLTAKGMLSGEHTLVNVYEIHETERSMVIIIKVFSYGFITLISLIAIANVFNTISTNIMLRRREFAMLKSVGMTSKGFNKMMNFECILYGFKSLAWGIPAAFGVTWLIYQNIARGYDTRFYIPWEAVAIAICSVFVVVFATMVYSMRKIKRDNPIDALKNENL